MGKNHTFLEEITKNISFVKTTKNISWNFGPSFSRQEEWMMIIREVRYQEWKKKEESSVVSDVVLFLILKDEPERHEK